VICAFCWTKTFRTHFCVISRNTTSARLKIWAGLDWSTVRQHQLLVLARHDMLVSTRHLSLDSPCSVHMASENEKLAVSLAVPGQLQRRGKRVFQSGEISRIHPERLLNNGFLRGVMPGWLGYAGELNRLYSGSNPRCPMWRSTETPGFLRIPVGAFRQQPEESVKAARFCGWNSVRHVYLPLCRIVVWVARRAQGTVATKASGPSIITAVAPQSSPWPRMTTADATTDIRP